jgi:LmbE family N-acetylglucosaminyl deacetylase
VNLLAGFDRALVIGAHTDDEFGAAGSIVRLIEAGCEVHYLALSRCEESVPPPYPPDTLERECREATAQLGIEPAKTTVMGYRVRHLPASRQEILEDFVRLNREIRPNLVFVPSSFDTHQDHAVVYEEGFRAFKQSTVLGYELPQNLTSFDNSAFVELSEEHMGQKVAALGAYKSQAFRPYAAPDFIRGLGRVRGVQANCQYAEAFEVVRLMIRR